MAKNLIPDEVTNKAKELGFNKAYFIHKRKNTLYYSLALLNEKGFNLPVGLPTIVAFAGNSKIKVFSGEEGFALLQSFNLK